MGAESQKIVFGIPLPAEKDARSGSRKPRLDKANRDQMIFQTIHVDTLIPEDHPARAIWEFVGKMDLTSLYLKINAVEGVAGRSATDPQTLISLWVYAYSQGISSAREMEKLCEYHPAFQWLTGMKVINHHTLSDFRIDNKEALDGLFTQCLGLLSAENLITLERVMHDGTKIKANAGADSFRTEERIQAHLKTAKEHIQSMGDPTDVPSDDRARKARERAAQERKTRLEAALRELEKIRAHKPDEEARQNARASQTDPEARIMKQSNGGYGPSYNVQISTDRASGVIVGVEATQEANDCNRLLPAVEKIQENTGRLPKQIVADGGYTNRQNILAMDEKGVEFIGSMPDVSKTTIAQFARRGIDPAFYPDTFRYNPKRNMYTCPAGRVLTYAAKAKRHGLTEHHYRANDNDCAACAFKEKCCPQSPKKGRCVVRTENHPVVSAFISKMNTPRAKDIYKQRGPTAEFPNAWIKEKMKLRQFRLRGLYKVGMECVWACLTYNIQSWIRLRWSPPGLSAAMC